MAIPVTPEHSAKMPYTLADDKPDSFADALNIAASTAERLETLNKGSVLPPEVDPLGAVEALKTALNKQDPSQLKTPAVALAARDFIRAYSTQLAIDAVEVRAALTNKLLEIANCGETKHELKAIELLGKHSDIALFTERSTVTVNYKSSSELEDAIRERITRLIASDPPPVPMTLKALDEELGAIDAEIIENE